MTNVGTPPSVCALNAGPLEVWVDSGAANSLEFLGWTEGGVRDSQRGFQREIHDDTAGGEQGPRIDAQLFGYEHRLEMDLVRWQDSVLAKVEGRYNPNNVSPATGMFLNCTNSLFRVLLYSSNFVRNYVGCYVLDPIRRSSIGTQFSRTSLSFTAYSPSGTLPWDATTTGRTTPPAVCALNAGILQVWVDTGASYAMEFLGYTTNGGEIEELGKLAPIHDDTGGGDSGPPTDYQLFGGEHRVSLELMKFQDTILAKLEKFYNVAQTPSVGQFLNCGAGQFRCLLKGDTFLRNYSASSTPGTGNCILMEPIVRGPIGTQATRARLSFTAPHLAGVTPWNSNIVTP